MMRLTLRTLLAYLDGILEPKDAEDLGKKVEESEYATGLVHRVRDVMRRMRLGAPTLTDRGPGLDPNTVAEYLDNTLAADRVTDFEKVCLDSDTHLAEVASCHQILTLVLGEPAEVDQQSRQRMYDVQDIPSGAKPPPPLTAAAPATSAAAPSLSLDLGIGDGVSGDRKPRPKPTVPEYLRESRRRRRWVPIAAVAAAAVCFLALVLGLFGQFEPGTFFGDILVSCGVIAGAPQEVAAKGDGKGETGDGTKDGKTQPEPAPDNGAAVEGAKEPAAKSGTEPSDKTSADGSAKKTTTPAEPAAAAGDGTKASAPKVTTKPDAGAATQPEAPSPAVGPKVTPKPKDEAAVVPPPPAGDGTKPPEPLPPPAAPEPLGRLLSSEQVLLSDNPPGGWMRVGPNQTLIPQQVLALPTYRPKVGLTAGVTAEILGGTRAELLGSSPQELPGMRIFFGRVVLMPLPPKGGTRLRVAFGDHSGTLTLVDAQTVVAFDVHHLHAPGTNPESGPPRVTADMFVTGGAATWEESVEGKAAQPLHLASAERVSFDTRSTGTPAAKEVPKWIMAGSSIRVPSPKEMLDHRASLPIAQSLPTDQPARIKLLELVTLRPQWEVKWLSLRCLGYVGQFHDIVVALNDPTQKLHWPDYFDALRAAVDRDPETAAAVRMALEKQYPEQARDLYRMLWGYTDKQLEFGDDGKRGEAAKLVQGLKNDEVLAVRVLSYSNLKDITGLGEIYQPEHSPARRQQEVHRWDQRLAAKQIRLKPGEERAGPAARENVTTPIPNAGQ